MPRHEGRAPDAIRPVTIQRRFTESAPGSVLYRCGRTCVLATASVDERVPPWMSGRGTGWVTAEYAMLPGSTAQRKARPSSTGRVDGRTHEIQRLIGRSLRAVVDMKSLGERTLWLDCEILEADGGTRTAAINASYVALCDALRTYDFKKPLAKWPIEEPIGAISVGIVQGEALCDLDYKEDHRAAVDMNVVMTSSGRFLELQGTGESRPFTPDELQQLIALAQNGVQQVLETVRVALTEKLP